MSSSRFHRRITPAAAVERPKKRTNAASALTRLFILVALAAAISGSSPIPQVVITTLNGKRLAAVGVELAVTRGQREFGLMYRTHLDKDAGMLFVFPTPARLRFWMKNTEIPLDMIFAGPSGRIVGIVADAKPYSEKPVGPNADALYVLEVNGGFCARHKVRDGDVMRFVGFKPEAKG